GYQRRVALHAARGARHGARRRDHEAGRLHRDQRHRHAAQHPRLPGPAEILQPRPAGRCRERLNTTVAAIELKAVGKRFAQTDVIKDVSLTIADGEFCVLVGPSGSGKSTLLRMIAGLEEVTSGELHIAGRDVTHEPPKARDIAMVFQSYAL